MKQKNEIKIKALSLLALAMLLSMGFAQTVFAYESLSLGDQAAVSALRVEAFDTVSGIEGLVKVSGGVAGAVAQVTVSDPRSSQHYFSKTLDARGATTVTLSGSTTVREGTYHVSVRAGAQTASTTFVAYGDSAPVMSDIGGDENLIAAATTVHHFEIANMPSSTTVGDRLNFTIKALDQAGAVVPSYRGTVRFSSTDRNAQVPEEYTFVPSDQGQRTFDLALTLRTNGSQKIFAEDKTDTTIRGEKIIEVLRGSFQAGSSEIYITKPTAGTYSTTTLDLEGGAPPNTEVTFFDNNQQIGTKQSDTGGRFTFKTPLLTDGTHNFYVEANNQESAHVEVTIDSTPAKADNVVIAEKTLAPGATTTISVTSDPDVSQIRATIGDFITDLEQDDKNPSLYTGQLVAPQSAGEYTVNVIVSDRLGNSADTIEVGKITVDAALQNEGAFDFSVPSTVTGVKAEGVLNGVMLTWQPAQAQAGIAFYRIYYGTTPNDLKQVVTTKTNEPNFLVSGLTVGTPYYFKVSGIDMRSNESDNLSAMVTATPTAVDTLSASAGDSLLCDPSPCPTFSYPPNTTENGPALLIPLIGSALGGLLVLRKK